MEEVIPLFKSHYSIGKSILTLENPADRIKGGPDSIIEICTSNNLQSLVLVDDSMSGFLEAHINAGINKLKLIFGLRLTICDDMEEKNPESIQKSHKIIIFIKTKKSYENLVKIFTVANKKGFYYEPRIDYKTLEALWDKDALKLCVPFYDSFLHKNFLENYACVPQLDFCPLTFFIEDNDLPFDGIIKEKVLDYGNWSGKEACEKVNVQSIYYRRKTDFKSYLTFRCINNRSTLDKPNLDHMCSENFCFEEWARKSNVVPLNTNEEISLNVTSPEEKDFDFKACDLTAQEGLKQMLKFYQKELDPVDIQKESNYHGDFRIRKGALINKTVELKTENYTLEIAGHPKRSVGFFIEHTSRTKTRKTPVKPKFDGGPWRAAKEDCVRIVHLMLPDGKAYWFDSAKLAARVKEYAENNDTKGFPIKQADGSGYTHGWVIPKGAVSDLITREQKIV